MLMETLTVSVVQLHATIEAAADGNGLARGDYQKISYTQKNAEMYTPAPEDLGKVVVRPVGVAPPPDPAVVDGTSVVGIAVAVPVPVAVAVGCPPPPPVLALVSDFLEPIRLVSPVAGALLADLTRLVGTVRGPCRKSSSGSHDALCKRAAIWRSHSLV